MCTDFQLVTSVYRVFEAYSTPSSHSNTPYSGESLYCSESTELINSRSVIISQFDNQ